MGKVRFRTWAEKDGRLATNSGVFNRELLIVEKENDGQPFQLHTSFEDRQAYYQSLRNPWLTLLVLFLGTGALSHSWFFLLFSGAAAVPAAVYQAQAMKAKKEAATREW